MSERLGDVVDVITEFDEFLRPNRITVVCERGLRIVEWDGYTWAVTEHVGMSSDFAITTGPNFGCINFVAKGE